MLEIKEAGGEQQNGGKTTSLIPEGRNLRTGDLRVKIVGQQVWTCY